jgi:DNA polymerase III alpha subunit (gram-positive type)
MPPFLLLALPAVGAIATYAAVWWIRASGARGPQAALGEIEFVAIDTETTGLDPTTDELVAVAAIPFAGGTPRLEEGLDRLVNPRRPIPEAARTIHGIGDADVRAAPPAEAVVPELLAACDGRPVVAHTAWFDLALINRAASRAGLPPLRGPVLDIGVLAHALFPSWWDLSLEGLGRLLEVEMVDRHTARGDALTAGLIFLHMIPRLEERGVRTLSAALRLQRSRPLIRGGPGPTGGGLSGP